MKDLVNDWNNQLVLLSPIAEIEPPRGYLAFVSGFKSNLNYFMGTIPGISQFLDPLEDIVKNKFLPVITVSLSIPIIYGNFCLFQVVMVG